MNVGVRTYAVNRLYGIDDTHIYSFGIKFLVLSSSFCSVCMKIPDFLRMQCKNYPTSLSVEL